MFFFLLPAFFYSLTSNFLLKNILTEYRNKNFKEYKIKFPDNGIEHYIKKYRKNINKYFNYTDQKIKLKIKENSIVVQFVNLKNSHFYLPAKNTIYFFEVVNKEGNYHVTYNKKSITKAPAKLYFSNKIEINSDFSLIEKYYRKFTNKRIEFDKENEKFMFPYDEIEIIKTGFKDFSETIILENRKVYVANVKFADEGPAISFEKFE